MESEIPASFADVRSLEEYMSRPNEALQSDLNSLDGDLIILGVSGKMGPTLALLAKRSAPEKRVIGVARFTDGETQQKLERWGVETIVCDLSDQDAVDKLPKVRNVIFMAGRKFGTENAEALTWAMNTLVPANVARAYSASRIVVLSTACVYPLADIAGNGTLESERLRPPPSDYTMSCVGRERIFEYYGGIHRTPGRFIRLSYAIDMRYGVLNDVASAVYEGRAVDVSTGYVNVIWQGDANSQVLRSLLHCTVLPTALNVSGPLKVSIRELAVRFGQLFHKDVAIEGKEAPVAWLVNTEEATNLFGEQYTSLDQMVEWTAQWLISGKQTYGKATKYDAKDGTY